MRLESNAMSAVASHCSRFAAIAVMALLAQGMFATHASAQNYQYEISFQGLWHSGLPRPGSAHFSPLIGATHNADGQLYSPGQLATTGIERVAELGSTSTLQSEINALIAAGDAGQIVSRGGDVGPTQTVTTTFTATGDHSRLTLLTMIAPSPDWFVGIDNLELRDANGNWTQEVVLDLMSYDAGTEEGSSFSLSNPPTNPRETIAGLDSVEPGNPLFGAGSIARMTVTRLTPIVEEVTPAMTTVTAGTHLSGGATELAQSDNVDFRAGRNTFDIQSRVIAEFAANSPSATPTNIEVTFEASVFARGAVNQNLEMWNYQTGAWEVVDTRGANRFQDTTVTVTASGDLSRFVEPISQEVLLRARYVSPSARQNFSANIDHVQWEITY
ncbi:MAG: spondin domain-containing protein [Planctomycetota bacterium]